MKPFTIILCGTLLGAWLASPQHVYSSQAHPESVPILLELFTSEGCSSCPPADKLLEELDRNQPIANADLIVLSEHVDYWNRLGWIDPNSSKAFSARQVQYSERLHADDVYTPQLVVDGSAQLVGSDRAQAFRAIKIQLNKPKTPIALRATATGDTAAVNISIDSIGTRSLADIYLVLALDHVRSKVTAGENSGRELTHTSVAYSMKRVGQVGSQPFSKQIDLPLRAGSKPSETIMVAFAEDVKTGRIVAAAKTRL
jgi:hypothetical protein